MAEETQTKFIDLTPDTKNLIKMFTEEAESRARSLARYRDTNIHEVRAFVATLNVAIAAIRDGQDVLAVQDKMDKITTLLAAASDKMKEEETDRE